MTILRRNKASSGRLFGHKPFLFYFWARSFSEFSYQIAAVAVGWQIYSLTNSAFDLGMVGLVQFIPTAILVFAAGHAADRYDRKRVVQVCQMVEGLTAAFLAWGSFARWLNLPEIFAAVAVFGTATAFENPASAALLPGVVPVGMLQKGTALSAGGFQVAMICAPALGGLAYAVSPGAPYAVMAAFWLLAGMLNSPIKLDQPAVAKEPPCCWAERRHYFLSYRWIFLPPTFAALFAGVGFVRHNPAILGTTPAIFCIPDLGGWACCAARPRLARCS